MERWKIARYWHEQPNWLRWNYINHFIYNFFWMDLLIPNTFLGNFPRGHRKCASFRKALLSESGLLSPIRFIIANQVYHLLRPVKSTPASMFFNSFFFFVTQHSELWISNLYWSLFSDPFKDATKMPRPFWVIRDLLCEKRVGINGSHLE